MVFFFCSFLENGFTHHRFGVRIMWNRQSRGGYAEVCEVNEGMMQEYRQIFKREGKVKCAGRSACSEESKGL